MAYDTKEAVLSLGTIDPELNDVIHSSSNPPHPNTENANQIRRYKTSQQPTETHP